MRNYRDMAELPCLYDMNDPLRGLPKLDSEAMGLMVGPSMETFASDDPRWVADWDANNNYKTLPVRVVYKKNSIDVVPEIDGTTSIFLTFDLGGVIWTHSYKIEGKRPSFADIKAEFGHKFSNAGLEWPAWRYND